MVYAVGALAMASAKGINPETGDELVSAVVKNCVDMDCVKLNVLSYLDNVLKIKSDTSRNMKVNVNSQIQDSSVKVKTIEIKMCKKEIILLKK